MFLDAAGHHAEVFGFDYDADAVGVEVFFEGFGDLLGEAFLVLEAAGEVFDDAWEFGEADDFFLRDVADCDGAEEWEHVVFAG